MLYKIIELLEKDYKFSNFEQVSKFFKNIINELKQMNYAEYKSDKFYEYENEVKKMVADI